MSIQTPKKHYVPLKVQDSVGQPGRVGGGGEEEEGPGGDDDQHGGDVVQEDVPLPPVSISINNSIIFRTVWIYPG